MSRSDTERDIVETLGQVPDFFATMPDDTLEREWTEWKHFQMEDTALTAREKHLIGLGVAAATHCPYCTYFHRAAAGMMGASDAQLEALILTVENDIEANFESEVDSSHVGKLVMHHLRELDDVAYVRFASVYRQFKDVHDFVSELRPMLDKSRRAR